MLRKIISAGRSDVARAAGAAAENVGMVHQFVIPTDPKPLNLRDLAGPTSVNPPIADAGNRFPEILMEADGTLVMTIGALDCTMETIRELAEKHRHPWMHIDFARVPAFKASKTISDWILKNRIQKLFVIGAEDNVDPKIYEKTLHVLTSVCWLLQRTSRSSDLPVDTAAIPDAERRPAHRRPVDVRQAVERLIAEMPLKDRATVSNMTEKELDTLNFTLGSYIRNKFGIWAGNDPLIISCRDVSGNPNLPQNDAASVIIKELWKTLRETHKLRLIKT